VSRRELIVNADDFGRSRGVNRGIARAHEHGVVTSASLMVRWPAAPEAARYARQRPDLSLGLHVDLGEWEYRDGTWEPAYVVVDTYDPVEVREAIAAQLAAFRDLVGRDPTHLDTHQHLHRDEPVRSATEAAAAEIGVPARELSPGIRHIGSFYGQTGTGEPHPEWISAEHLLGILEALEPGLSELGCHPGLDDDAGGAYVTERAIEVKTLCDPRLRQALADLEIVLRPRDGVSCNDAVRRRR
jgi:chitin disaccharide deacetylase